MNAYPCKILDTLTLKHPLILSSGISGNSDGLLVRAARSGASAVTTKGFTLNYKKGSPNPVSTDWGCGLITNLGLTNPGAESMKYMISAYRKALGESAVPVFVNLAAETPEEFAALAASILSAEPAMIEIDLPKLEETLATEITRAVREAAGATPVSVKLSPNCCAVGKLAAAVKDAGANLITAINPMPGMLVDAYAKRPFLSSGTGWVSGPAIKPMALNCIAEIAQAVDLPIIGMGGVMTGLDMVEMMMAGATVVGIGSALYYDGYDAFQRILQEFDAFMVSEKYDTIEAIVGKLWRD